MELLIGRLATDPDLVARFAACPAETLRTQALELNDVELEALAGTDPEAFRALADALDARLRRATPTTKENVR